MIKTHTNISEHQPSSFLSMTDMGLGDGRGSSHCHCQNRMLKTFHKNLSFYWRCTEYMYENAIIFQSDISSQLWNCRCFIYTYSCKKTALLIDVEYFVCIPVEAVMVWSGFNHQRVNLSTRRRNSAAIFPCICLYCFFSVIVKQLTFSFYSTTFRGHPHTKVIFFWPSP